MALLHRLRRPDETFTPDHADGVAVTIRDLPSAGLAGYRPGPVGPAGRARLVAGTTRPDVPERPALPPSVARVAARTRLSAELLAAILEVDARPRATLDDIERADALAERLLARRADRQRAAATGRRGPRPAAGLDSGIRLAG